MTRKSNDQLLRIIVGNQLTLMEALRQQAVVDRNHSVADLMNMRIHEVKDWWWGEYRQLVGPTTDRDRERVKPPWERK